MNDKPKIYWLTKGGIRGLRDFRKFWAVAFWEKLKNETEEEIVRLTAKTYAQIRKAWSGGILDVKTGRMLRSLKVKLRLKKSKKEGRFVTGIIYSDRSLFRNVYYYPLTHEAFGRPYTIITPKTGKYLVIPPRPEKGYFKWIKAKRVKIPKRPVFQWAVEDLRNQLPKISEKIGKISVKLFGRGK